MPRPSYPSDHRRWFRVREDILDDQKLTNVSAEAFRFFIRLLAMLNRTKTTDGNIRLDRYALNGCAMREQLRHSRSTAREGATAGLYSMREDGSDTLFRVPKWAKTQELSPARLRSRSGRSPSTKTTPKTTPKTNRKDGSQGPLLEDQDQGSASTAVTLCTRVVSAWPSIRAAFFEYGRKLGDAPGSDRIELIGRRLSEGRSETELVAAVHGYVVFHRGLETDASGFNPRQYFRVETVFKADGFSDRVDLGMGPRDAIPKRQATASNSTQRSIGEWQNS